jgi:ATP-dependent helicase/nuclease subunit B
VRNVLGVRPPDDLERDSTRWLEPRDEGSLLHEVFRAFLEDLTRRGEKPDADRHAEVLFALAEERIEAWRERVPPSSEVAFQAQRETIRHACRTFLAAEAEHCRRVTPRWFEVGFGMRGAAEGGMASAEPIEIALGRGERVLLRGSIDRVDEAEDGTFHVWDYKTGSAAGIQEGRGLHGGRQAQPALYALAFEQLLKRSGRAGRVSLSGYFFPGRKGEGQRVTIPVDAEETGRALSRLFDLAGAGLFPHAASKLGCRFCEFESVCGGPEASSEASQRKLAAATDTILTAFRQLHGHEDD